MSNEHLLSNAGPARNVAYLPHASVIRHPAGRTPARVAATPPRARALRSRSRLAAAPAHAWETVEVLDGPRLWQKPARDVELSVVVPFYNPGAALRRTVERLVECLRSEGVGFEVIAVSDGSTDGSERSLDLLAPEVRVVVNRTNQGKGAALHQGFARAQGEWVGFVDADGDIDPAHVLEYLRIAREQRPAAVYADKRHEASASGATAKRKIVSRVYSTLVTSLFALGIRDTQSGCKIFRRDVLAAVLPNLRELRFAFDLEFFVAAKAAGYHELVPAPVRLETRQAGSTVTSRAIVRTVKDTFVIFGRRRLRGHYAPMPELHTARRVRDLATAMAHVPTRIAAARPETAGLRLVGQAA